MHHTHPGVVLRKTLLYLFVAVLAVLSAIGIADWRAQAEPGISADIGVPALLGPDNAGGLIVSGLEPGSPLALAGVGNGDSIRFDHRGTNYRGNFHSGEQIGLTWRHNDTTAHLLITATARPHLDRRSEIFATFIRWLPGLISLLVAVAIVHLKGDDGVMRAFAWSLLFNAPMTVIYNLPGGALQDACALLLRPIEQVGGYACLLYFTLRYPDPHRLWARPRVRATFIAATSAMAAISFTQFAIFNGLCAAPVTVWRVSRFMLSLFVLAMIAVALTLLWRAWRENTGSQRNRLGWIVFCMGVLMGAYMVVVAYGLVGLTPPAFLQDSFVDGLSLLATAGFAYALLRHRVFDFGFVLNRALVFTFTSTFLLVVFSLSEFAVDKCLHFESRQQNIAFDALVALAIILCFHRIQHWIGHKVDYLFFHAWHEAAGRFDRAMERAAHITEVASLHAEFARALRQFCGCGGVAIYAARPDNRLQRQYSSVAPMPECIDANDDIAVSLRHVLAAVEPGGASSCAAAERALPMLLRGGLAGAVMVATRPDGQTWRPDELARIATGVQRLTLLLEGLRVSEVEYQAGLLRQHLELAEQKLALSEAVTAELRQLLQPAPRAR